MARSLFRHILVPYDFSPQAAGALKVAAQLAKKHRGTLTGSMRWSRSMPADVSFGMQAPGDFLPEHRELLQRR